MKWENPQLLYFLLAVPLLFFLALILQKAALQKLQKHMGSALSYLWSQNLSMIARYWKWILRCMCLGFILLALARPQLGQSQQAVKSEGFEIFLALDVSESMMAEDLRPSRLEKAKIDLSRLIDQLGGHKIGVIAFAGTAAVISPLTQDIAAVKMYIESLDSQTISSQGTNFENALKTASEAFERGGVGSDEASGVTRVLLIASDGEDQEQGALDQVSQLLKKNIRVFTVAYGTEKGAPISVRDQRGFLKGYKKDKQGQTILTTVKGEALKALAEKGRGFFIFASSDSSFIAQVSAELNELEKKQFESEMQVQYDEKFQIPLLLAFIFGVIELLIQERRRKWA